jgi:hypothetical protein
MGNTKKKIAAMHITCARIMFYVLLTRDLSTRRVTCLSNNLILLCI